MIGNNFTLFILVVTISILCCIITFHNLRSSTMSSQEYYKINDKGEYGRFPGVTVVAAVGEKNADLWSRIYATLDQSQMIKDHFALLPVSSYHMTTINLFNARYTNQNWHEFIQSKLDWFANLHREILHSSFQPQVVRIQPQFRDGWILLKLDLPEEQLKANSELASRMGLLDKLPDPQYHITLAYLYNDIDERELPRVKNEFVSLITKVLDGYHSPILLNKPLLTYFNDMTAFIPWSGDINPF
jgi:hypothetical protein